MKIIYFFSKINFLIKVFLFFILLSTISQASGAYDKGTATGKGKFELSITINPFGIIPYGQNYTVLSYGLSNKIDLVGYYSLHKNNIKSQYFGVFYQFFDSKRIDLATAFGVRHKSEGIFDFFSPQLLYNYKINYDYSIGGSLVKVIDFDNLKNKGNAIDVTLYKKIKLPNKLKSKINDVYFGIGVFNNARNNLMIDKLYFHYSLDMVF